MTRPFLIDTCAALWIVAGEIKPATANILTVAYNKGLPTYVSPVTAWEIGISARKGRFTSPYSPQRWMEILMSAPNTFMAELTVKILMESCFLSGLGTNDPSDRIIAATAREFGYTVLTRDRALLDYGAQGHLSVLEC